MRRERCSGCGWAGGGAECRARFDACIARDFSDSRFFAVHRMLVDAYCLQHPDDFCRSAKSLAAHLAGLCWILEEGAGAAHGPKRLRDWLDGPVKLDKPPLPVSRGEVVLADLPTEAPPEQWSAAVRRWADAVWNAYAPLHAVARTWVAAASG